MFQTHSHLCISTRFNSFFNCSAFLPFKDAPGTSSSIKIVRKGFLFDLLTFLQSSLHVSFAAIVLKVPITPKLFSASKNLCVFVSKMVKKLLFLPENLIFYAPSKSQKITEKIRTTELVRGLGLFLGWHHKLFCMHVYKELMLCKWIYDINPGIDPGPSQARSCSVVRTCITRIFWFV